MTALIVRDDCLICLFLEDCQAECRAVLDISCPNRTRGMCPSAVLSVVLAVNIKFVGLVLYLLF